MNTISIFPTDKVHIWRAGESAGKCSRYYEVGIPRTQPTTCNSPRTSRSFSTKIPNAGHSMRDLHHGVPDGGAEVWGAFVGVQPNADRKNQRSLNILDTKAEWQRAGADVQVLLHYSLLQPCPLLKEKFRLKSHDEMVKDIENCSGE